MGQFFMTHLLKQIILAVYHNFQWVLVGTKLLTAKLHSLYVTELEWKILGKVGVRQFPPTLQFWISHVPLLRSLF